MPETPRQAPLSGRGSGMAKAPTPSVMLGLKVKLMLEGLTGTNKRKIEGKTIKINSDPTQKQGRIE